MRRDGRNAAASSNGAIIRVDAPSPTYWRQPLRWNANAGRFFDEHGRRQRVFCASLADVFDNQVPEEWRHDLWELIAECREVDWLLLTKRPQNIAKMLPASCAVQIAGQDWPWPHVWLGTTAENQDEADRRIPFLLNTPAAVRFVSAEPLLGPIDFTFIRARHWARTQYISALTGEHNPSLGVWGEFGKLDWVICGGESGPHARPMHPEWARSVRDQCQAAGVAFFFKQWGSLHPVYADPPDAPGVHYMCRPDGSPHMVRGPKNHRILDGREHSEFPDQCTR